MRPEGPRHANLYWVRAVQASAISRAISRARIRAASAACPLLRRLPTQLVAGVHLFRGAFRTTRLPPQDEAFDAEQLAHDAQDVRIEEALRHRMW